MKRFIAAMALVACFALGLSAQKAEFQIGYGGYTEMDGQNCSKGIKTDNAWGALTAGVNFKIAPNLMIGPSYTFSSQSFKPGGGNVYYHVLMLNGRYNYYRTSVVTLYAHAGLGAMISHIAPDAGDSSDHGYVAYQISPVGMQVGINRAASFFAELGYGAQGVAQVGFRFGF